jgi:hypothetical protein
MPTWVHRRFAFCRDVEPEPRDVLPLGRRRSPALRQVAESSVAGLPGPRLPPVKRPSWCPDSRAADVIFALISPELSCRVSD